MNWKNDILVVQGVYKIVPGQRGRNGSLYCVGQTQPGILVSDKKCAANKKGGA